MKRKKLLYLNEIEPDYDKKIEIIKRDNFLDSINEKNVEVFVKEIKCNYVTLFDKEYPKLLKLLARPPLVIYYLGNLALLEKNIVAIIGVVNPTNYSKKATIDIASNIDNNSVLISNYSYGNSHLALIYGVKYGKNIIASISYGFSYLNFDKYIILKEIEKSGLVISITPYYQRSTRDNYRKTVEAIIMLSNSVLIMQGRKNSSQIRAANYAIDYSKDVYVLPGSIYDENFIGSNNLIQDGANILYTGIKI